MFVIKQTARFKKDFAQLSPAVKNRLLEKIALLAKGRHSQLDIKKLRGVKNLFRLRAGSYRILYQQHRNKLLIVLVRADHRKDIYQ